MRDGDRKELREGGQAEKILDRRFRFRVVRRKRNQKPGKCVLYWFISTMCRQRQREARL